MNDEEYERLNSRLSIHERLARLEVNDRILMGNGQPGEIASLKKKIDELKWWIIGSVILGTASGSGLSHLLSVIK